MKIDRAILSSDDHPNYIEFWPIVAKAWRAFGVRPTLLYTGNDDSAVDYSAGDVIRIPRIEGVDSAFVAQASRLLCPAIFSDDVCIISDIDDMPLSKDYYFNSISTLADDKFVIYRPDVCAPDQIAICWTAARGTTWSEVFSVSTMSDIIKTLKNWSPNEYRAYRGHGQPHDSWSTDQKLLKKYVEDFRKTQPARIVELDDNATGFFRLDRTWTSGLDDNYYLNYHPEKHYSDFHMPRPYNLNKNIIDEIFKQHIEKRYQNKGEIK